MNLSCAHLKEDLESFEIRTPVILSSAQQATVRLNGREVINLSSNDYLGLATDSRMRSAAKAAIERYGVGAGAAMNIAGYNDLYKQLELRVAEIKCTEAAIVFQSGFMANIGVIGSMFGEEDVVVSDALNHASIIDGCRLSRAKREIYAHNDLHELETILKRSQSARKRAIVTDGVFSVEGDIARLPAIVELAERYGALIILDDAHATGVLGPNGRGTAAHFSLENRIHIQVGTFSKALGSVGGYVAASKAIIEYLRSRSRPILFSTSLPPPAIACALAAIDVLQNDPSLISRLWHNRNFFAGELQSRGLDISNTQTPIIPIMVGNEAKTVKIGQTLLEGGVFATPLAYPVVPKGRARLRTMIRADHTRKQLIHAADCLRKVFDAEDTLIRETPHA